MKFFRILLFPFSIIYGLITKIRNKLFDWKILSSKKFSIPIISVGNLSVGGTGKTPHVDYLIRLLKGKYQIATLSRGYGRKTSGFILANVNSIDKEIGDEPLMYAKKHPSINVAVDGNRVRGIKKILEAQPETNVVLMDDAYQHLHVIPGLSILLTDYFALYTSDYLLPTGNLRESRKGAKRADIIVVTKTPKVFSPLDRRLIINKINPLPHQSVFFSYIKYGNFLPLLEKTNLLKVNAPSKILLFTGIANPSPFEEYLKRQCNELVSIKFKDHHQFTNENLKKIRKKFESIFSNNKIIVTTEKDRMRLFSKQVFDVFADLPVYYVPIEIEFHKDDLYKNIMDFDTKILEFLQKSNS